MNVTENKNSNTVITPCNTDISLKPLPKEENDLRPLCSDKVEIGSYQSFQDFKSDTAPIRKGISAVGNAAESLNRINSSVLVSSDLLKNTGAISEACGNIGTALAVGFTSIEITSALADKSLDKEEKKTKVGGSLGAFGAGLLVGTTGFEVGFSAGGAIGGAIGGIVGSIIPGAGTVAGAALGAEIGSLAGAVIGTLGVSKGAAKIGRWFGEKIGTFL